MSIALQRLFARYSGFLRRIKAAYVLNNLLNADRLRHNVRLYRRAGLKKSIFSPIGRVDFDPLSPPDDLPWLDRPDALERLQQHPRFQQADPVLQTELRRFVTEGYMVLRGQVPATEVEELNKEVAVALNAGQTGFNFTGRKIFNFFEQSRLAEERFFKRPDLLELLSFLLGKKVLPFQSLNFVTGSEQRAHSDYIHMATWPEGYLIAAWYALEPCTPDNGPVAYYPGSHRLPYPNTRDYDSGNSYFLVGNDSNAHYEDKVAKMIQENGFQKALFLAQPGDVLIWHANLLHAGSPINGRDAAGNPLTRKSMVCHYYAEDVICYHEMLQRPALIKKDS